MYVVVLTFKTGELPAVWTFEDAAALRAYANYYDSFEHWKMLSKLADAGADSARYGDWSLHRTRVRTASEHDDSALAAIGDGD